MKGLILALLMALLPIGASASVLPIVQAAYGGNSKTYPTTRIAMIFEANNNNF